MINISLPLWVDASRCQRFTSSSPSGCFDSISEYFGVSTEVAGFTITLFYSVTARVPLSSLRSASSMAADGFYISALHCTLLQFSVHLCTQPRCPASGRISYWDLRICNFEKALKKGEKNVNEEIGKWTCSSRYILLCE